MKTPGIQQMSANSYWGLVDNREAGSNTGPPRRILHWSLFPFPVRLTHSGRFAVGGKFSPGTRDLRLVIKLSAKI